MSLESQTMAHRHFAYQQFIYPHKICDVHVTSPVSQTSEILSNCGIVSSINRVNIYFQTFKIFIRMADGKDSTAPVDVMRS